MIEAEPIVFVVDDDPSVRRSMERLSNPADSKFKPSDLPANSYGARDPKVRHVLCLMCACQD